jgi:hypothetical protein
VGRVALLQQGCQGGGDEEDGGCDLPVRNQPLLLGPAAAGGMGGGGGLVVGM